MCMCVYVCEFVCVWPVGGVSVFVFNNMCVSVCVFLREYGCVYLCVLFSVCVCISVSTLCMRQ